MQDEKEKNEKGAERIITANGLLKSFSNELRKSRNGNEYFFGLLEPNEIKEGFKEEEIKNEKHPLAKIWVFFWKKNHSPETLELISNFKEGQNITVSGILKKKTGGFSGIETTKPAFFMSVISIETDSEFFV